MQCEGQEDRARTSPKRPKAERKANRPATKQSAIGGAKHLQLRERARLPIQLAGSFASVALIAAQDGSIAKDKVSEDAGTIGDSNGCSIGIATSFLPRMRRIAHSSKNRKRVSSVRRPQRSEGLPAGNSLDRRANRTPLEKTGIEKTG
jgi:hypothetical protein